MDVFDLHGLPSPWLDNKAVPLVIHTVNAIRSPDDVVDPLSHCQRTEEVHAGSVREHLIDDGIRGVEQRLNTDRRERRVRPHLPHRSRNKGGAGIARLSILEGGNTDRQDDRSSHQPESSCHHVKCTSRTRILILLTVLSQGPFSGILHLPRFLGDGTYAAHRVVPRVAALPV